MDDSIKTLSVTTWWISQGQIAMAHLTHAWFSRGASNPQGTKKTLPFFDSVFLVTELCYAERRSIGYVFKEKKKCFCF
jgi:hypothetical protein